MKRFRVFFNEGILSTIEAETEEEARKRFLKDELKEIDMTKDLDMWFDFEEVPIEPRSESLDVWQVRNGVEL